MGCDRFLISSDNKLWEIRHNELAHGQDSGKVRIVEEWEETPEVSYDNACKYLAEQYPAEFVNWLLSVQLQDIQVLKTELTLEPIRADAVTFLQTAN